LFGLPIVLDTDNESLRPGQNVRVLVRCF
jgi:hypothetical protein